MYPFTMNHSTLQKESLVLYKSGPARITAVEEKIEIQLPNGKSKRVREKDIVLLHPGPLRSLSTLDAPLEGEIEEAWELLGDETLALEELSELIFGESTPHTHWCSWKIIREALYFHGTPDAIQGHPRAHIEEVQQARNAKLEAQQKKEAFLERLRSGALLPEDHTELSDVEMLALKRSEVSRILRDLGRDQRPENAHHLLLDTAYWEPNYNPYPARMEVESEAACGEVPDLPQQERVDLTHLTAWAIDDEGNQDPDDAISLQGERIWVHVADVAALITPDSELDLQARARGANLYLPEGTLTMLPPKATELLGLGLQQRSPALSFSFTLSEEAEIEQIEVVTSWIKVNRTTYASVDQEINNSDFAPLYEKALQYQEKRLQQGAIRLELPEVKIRVVEDEVKITPLPKLRSRDLVTEFMLMAGEAAARFAQQHEIPFPYSTQPPPGPDEQGNPYPQPETLAEMYAFRRRFRRSQLKSQPAPHAGLGMSQYSQVTSPLRRYLDLVAHQQLRAWIEQRPLLDSEALTERVGAAEAVIGNVRRAERFSNRHWSMVWLRQQQSWQGEGILVDIMKQRGTFLIPQLGLECKARLKEKEALNHPYPLTLSEVDLPELTAYFRT
jgi:exoribonuclease-2